MAKQTVSDDMTAYCDRRGVITIGTRCPRFRLALARSSSVVLAEAIAGTARLAYDGVTWLVPGIPEADGDDAAAAAAADFSARLNRSVGQLTGGLG